MTGERVWWWVDAVQRWSPCNLSARIGRQSWGVDWGGGGRGRETSKEKEGATVCNYNSKKARDELELEHILATIEVKCSQNLEIIRILPSVCNLLTSVVDPDPDPSPSPHQIEM
jgi:hypothetical protein